ncbi:MAG: DNA-binding response regulator, LuxR family [Candidatus Acidoferrum typicum]|nr:DNA-binding response regulator, LuxR family [Candidatus Acidoferrum typicum]
MSVSRSNISLLIADKSRMGCQLMATALRRSRYGLTVLDCVLESAAVLRTLKENRADVAVISAHLKDGPDAGFDLTREIRTRYPTTDVVMLLDSVEPSAVIEAFRAGATGILSRDDPFQVLCKCIYVVSQGQVWAGSRDLRFALDALRQSACALNKSPSGSAKVTKPANTLTSREESLVDLVAEGMTNRDISRHLHLSEHTVRNYLFRIFNKLGTSTRLELALYVLHRKKAGRIHTDSSPEPLLSDDAEEKLPQVR